MKRLILLLSTAVFAFSCVEKPAPEPTPGTMPEKSPINISTSITKATDTEFEQGDQIGIYVVNEPASLQQTGNHVDNMRFTFSDSWEPDSQIYWKDKTTKADFYCYYPYNSDTSEIESYRFSVKADQTTEENYKACDFLWGRKNGVPPTENAVDITVNHLMSNVIIKLVAGNGYKEEDMHNASVTICGLKTSSLINLADGTVTAEGDAEDILPYQESTVRKALVIPQSITGADIIKVSIGDRTYKLNQSITFVSGRRHTCTLTIEKTSQGINIGIGGWENSDEDFGGTVE